MAADLSTLPPTPPPRRVSKQATTRPAAVQETVMAAVQNGNDAVTKPSRQLQRLPAIRGGGGGGGARADGRDKNGAIATENAERAAKAWMRHALAKRVATRMLRRSTAPPRASSSAAADEGSGGGGGRAKKVLACCCARLPRGLRCALHQTAAPGRAWMRAAQRPRGGDGEECVAVVALAPPRAYGWAFSEYARWRRHVWMPSRFYLEHVAGVDRRALLELGCSAEIDVCVDSALR